MTDYEFSSDWFSHHIDFWTKVFRSAGWNANEEKTVVEIGSFEGRSTVWSCRNLLLHPSSRIFCVDTFAGSVEHSESLKADLFSRFRHNVATAGIAEKVEVRRGESWQELCKLIAEGVRADVIYIDGSHQAPDVLEDACLSFRLLRHGGLMMFDDYHWTIERHGAEDILNSPKLAVDMFFNIYRRKVKLFAQSAHQIVLQKTL